MLLIKFLIVIFVCFSFKYVLAAERGANIGTVLFAPSDANRDCWSADNLALLTARMVLEGVLPNRKSLNVNDPRLINDVIEYFRLIMEVVRKNTTGKTKHIMLLALTDTLGGYMKHFFLPVAKYAYYAGNVEYSSVIKVHQLFDELKNYLRTNGAGWSKPAANIGKEVVAQPIQIHEYSKDTDYCKGLVITEKGLEKRRDSARQITIAMPYFDSKMRPSAIALPFKSFSLRNIESKSAAYVLVKFYIASTKCLTTKDVAPSSLQDFNTNLFSFIMDRVMPHFCDERFYAAFGGVLRIIETMKAAGFINNGKVIGSFNIMPEVEDKDVMKGGLCQDAEDEDVLDKNIDFATECKLTAETKRKKSKSNLLVLAALATIIIWFFLGACFVCCRIRSARKKDDQIQLLEGGDGKSSTRHSTRTCLSSVSSKTKCSTMSGKTMSCNRQTCANFSSSSISGQNVAPTGSATSKTSASESGSCKSETTPSNHSVTDEKPSGSPNAQYSPTRSYSPEQGNSPKGTSTPITVQTAQYYPATFACHSSMSGKYKAGSSSEEFSSKSTLKKPFVFGYDFQTTSEESSPRGIGETSDGETEMGNMSK